MKAEIAETMSHPIRKRRYHASILASATKYEQSSNKPMGMALPMYKARVIEKRGNRLRIKAAMMPLRQALIKNTRSITRKPNQLTPEITNHNIPQRMPVQMPHKVDAMRMFRVVCCIISLVSFGSTFLRAKITISFFFSKHSFGKTT